MKKIVAVFLGVSMSNCVLASDGSPELKSESQAVIRNAGYQCDKVNGVFLLLLVAQSLCSAMTYIST